MPHSHDINYYIGRMDDVSLSDLLADFEDPLEGESADLLSSFDLEEDFCDGEFELDFDDL